MAGPYLKTLNHIAALKIVLNADTEKKSKIAFIATLQFYAPYNVVEHVHSELNLDK